MKKTIYMWIIIVTLSLLTIFNLIDLILMLNNININIINIFIILLQIAEIIVLSIYIFKLYNYSDNLIKWTNLIFGFSLFYESIGILGIPLMYYLYNPIYMLFGIIILLSIFIIIWVTFVKHLKKNKSLSLISEATISV